MKKEYPTTEQLNSEVWYRTLKILWLTSLIILIDRSLIISENFGDFIIYLIFFLFFLFFIKYAILYIILGKKPKKNKNTIIKLKTNIIKKKQEWNLNEYLSSVWKAFGPVLRWWIIVVSLLGIIKFVLYLSLQTI